MRRPALPALAAIATVAVLAVTALGPGAAPTPPERLAGGVLTAGDRVALGAAPVVRGVDAPPPEPGVDLTDPAAVARAHLTAAHSARPADAGRTQLRAAAYAEPGSPAAAVGVVVVDAPPAGFVRTVTVDGLALVGATADGTRRAYRADLGTATGPPGGPATVVLTPVRVALARRPDGRWLVTAESSDFTAGED